MVATELPSEVELARKIGKVDPLWRTLTERANFLIHKITFGEVSSESSWYDQKERLAREAAGHLLEARDLISEDYDPDKFARTSETLGKVHKLIARLSSLDDVGIADVSRLYKPESGHLSERTIGFLKDAIRYYEDSLRAHGNYSYHRTREGLLSEIGEEYVQLRDWDRAIEHFEKAAEVGRLSQFDVAVGREELAYLIRWFQKITECGAYSFVRAGRYTEALSYADDAKARLLIKFFGLNTLRLPDDERGKLERLREEQAAIEKQLAEPIVVGRREKVERVMAIRIELEDIAGQVARPASSVIETRLRELIDEDTLLIAPILSSLGGETIFAYTQNGSLHVDHARSKDALYFKKMVQDDGQSWLSMYARYKASRDETRQEHGRVLTQAIQKSSAVIDDLFLGALEEALEQRNIFGKSKIIIVPHDALARLPIAAARLSDGRHLLDTYEPVYLPSIGAGVSVAHLDSGAHPNSLAIANVIDDAGSDPKMPRFNDAECALVGGFSTGSVKWLERDQAEGGTRAVLSGLADSRIWHFTAHGRFNELDPSQSRLGITSDQTITLGELYAAGHQSRPDLVVLSACESGLYDCEDLPNEFIGWPSAFLEMGAKGVIATQWPVASLPTTLLMAKLYEEMWKEDGITVSAALRAAQMWIKDVPAADLPPIVERWVEAGHLDRKNADDLLTGLEISGCAADGRAFPEPIYWAGFVYYGDPRLRLRH